MPMPADSQQTQAERTATGQFVKGRSGNPVGRLPGSRNRVTMLVEHLFEEAGSALADKAVAMALAGDAAALRLCLGRIIAPRRHRATSLALPPLRTAADCAPAIAAIAAAAADGTLSTAEASELIQVVDAFVRALEAGEFDERLQRLERVLHPAA
jgi:hypothetical protein